MLLRFRTRWRSSANTWCGCFSRLVHNLFSKRWLGSVCENLASSLAGKRVVITRRWFQSAEIACQLEARRAVPLVRPLMEFADPEDFGLLDGAITALGQFD